MEGNDTLQTIPLKLIVGQGSIVIRYTRTKHNMEGQMNLINLI